MVTPGLETMPLRKDVLATLFVAERIDGVHGCGFTGGIDSEEDSYPSGHADRKHDRARAHDCIPSAQGGQAHGAPDSNHNTD